MKNFFIIIMLIGLNSFCFAQNSKLKKADKLFAKKAYVEAALLYKQLKPSPEVLQNLGDCYYYNFKMAQAKVAFDKLFENYKDGLDPEVYFRYAQALKSTKDYENADKIMSEYLGYTTNTTAFIEKLNKVLPYNYEIESIKSGSSLGDFGLSYFGDKVVFASLRNEKNPTYSWNNKPYLDLYEATISEQNVLENIQPFSKKINTKSHESSATMTQDGTVMYFSRTNNKRVDIGEEKIATVKIFQAELKDRVWTNIKELPFTSDTYSTQHPVLNKDHTRLYFSSDMPGSLGSFDIFYVEIKDNSFGTPVNLGSNINTKHREQFPFVDQDETLYFASDGHLGLGGLDMFYSLFQDGTHQTPINLGETINSGMDDFAYVHKKLDQTGYFSSNRTSIDKLYAFTRVENQRTFIIEGVVIDKNTKELLPNAIVTLFDEDGIKIGDIVVGDDAAYSFEDASNKSYTIEGHRQFYIPSSEFFTTDDEGKIEYNIELVIESYDDAEDIVVTKDDGYIYIELENIYFDLDKWDIKPQAARTLDVLVNLLRKYPRMEIQLGAHTDSRSSDAYNLRLSLNRANATLKYLVSNGIDENRLRAKGYGESQPLVNCGDNCTDDEHAINRRCEFIITK